MFSSKHLGEIVYDDDFCKILKLQNDVKENDDFKNAKIYRYLQLWLNHVDL